VIPSHGTIPPRQSEGTKIPFIKFENHTMATFGRTWIVVLDDSRARFFRREQSGSLTQAAPDVIGSGGDDQPPTPESRKLARDKVLRATLETVDAACTHSECERIVVMAPERLLGVFRRNASDKVRVRLWRERASEVSALSTEDIAQSLEMYFRPGVR
jgi:protein required for attachment to host cells